MSGQNSGTCWNCGNNLGENDYFRESTCPNCRKYTHVCKNCRFYSSAKANGCLEPVAEVVNDKERSNFCGYFEAIAHSSSSVAGTSQADLLKAAEDLFN